MLTASLEALSAGPIEVGDPAEVICGKVCRRLFERTPPAKYATMFLSILEPGTGKLSFTNAGHNAGLLIRSGGDAEQLGTSGMPIGLMKDGNYSELTNTMSAGDILVLYTDGITEAESPDGEEFGIERLQEVCVDNRGKSLEDLAGCIQTNLDQFASGVPYADDRTFVLVRRA